ncbi:hypothetical protein I79_012302 [Cricetulus griseus]|uniref:Uncharacterized protein n=1 Tax=Cricetulus griseus TaxID=10029 RepID=G3HNG4_CRIGR|nr:hypothetical protein I79_012302 [Cricetulus griseus]
MAQQLRAPTALPEDSGSIPSTHTTAHNCNSSSRDVTPSHRHTCRQNTNARNIKINYKKEKNIVPKIWIVPKHSRKL